MRFDQLPHLPTTHRLVGPVATRASRGRVCIVSFRRANFAPTRLTPPTGPDSPELTVKW